MLTKKLTLSAFQPVKLNYSYDKTSELKSEYKQFNGGLRYYEHEALNGFGDISISNESVLILTKNLPYNNIFVEQQKQLNIKDLCGLFSLSAKDSSLLAGDIKIKYHSDGRFYVGGRGQDVLFNAIPASENKIRLEVNKKRVQITKNYPYEMYLSEDPLPENESYRELFDITYRSNKAQLKMLTIEGFRYLSFGVDRVLRGVGLELNEADINSYKFSISFLGSDSLLYGVDQNTKEVKYYNTNEPLSEKKALNIKQYKDLPTNLLIDFPVTQAQYTTTIGTNIASLKTNFTTTGTFNATLTSNETETL
jgi:hypothetical protein